MTDQPESPDYSGGPPTSPPPAGQSPYPYAYPPGAPGPQGYAPGPQGYAPGPQGYDPGPQGYDPGPQAYAPGPYPGAYPPPPMPYGEYYPGAPMPPRNGLGVTALVLAVIALVASCSVVGGLVLGIAAIIIGFLGRGRVTRGEANNGGIALTGIILGALAVIVSLAFIALYSNVFNEYGGRDLVSCVQSANGDNDKVQQCMDEFQRRVDSGTGRGTIPG